MIEILKAPPLATVQDLGFPEGRSWGLPPGGAMDPQLLGLANALVGNPAGSAAIEWTLGPGELRFDRDTRVAVLGLAEIRVNNTTLDPPQLALIAPAKAAISILPGACRRFTYLAVAGGISVPMLLGSRSTYLPGGFGGHEGRALKAGDRLRLGSDAGEPAWGTTVSVPGLRPHPGSDLVLRVTRGPQWRRFDEDARETFFSGRYTSSPASDRMGYRLIGPAVRPRETATLPSEAACPGTVQVPDGGQPIVLMPDGPTVGGYPKLAVVIRADLRLLAQCPPERGIRFREVSLEEARACYPESP